MYSQRKQKRSNFSDREDKKVARLFRLMIIVWP